MSEDKSERRVHEREPIGLQVRCQYHNLEEFIVHFATNISEGGLFLQSRKPLPKGSILHFDIQLKTGKSVLKGKGEVIWIQQPSPPGSTPKVPGMGVKFLGLDAHSQEVFKKILRLKAHKNAKGSEKDQPVPQQSATIATRRSASPPATLPKSNGKVSSRVIGVDLGTTNSCAAIVNEGKPQVILSRKGYRTIPSIVTYTDEGHQLVGHPAKSQMELNPRNTVYGSKRLIGRPFDSPAVSQMKDRFHYEIIAGQNHQAAVQIMGRTFSLQQVASLILTEMREIAQDFLHEEVTKMVITVPAYYNDNQRQAVREAAILAGLQVERIVNEPTAAALAFGYNRSLDQHILVYDLGGGTFDVSVLELCENVYEVIATGGDAFLGGVDFDNQLVDYLLHEFCTKLGCVPELSRASLQRLRDAAEHAKCVLSQKEEHNVHLPYFTSFKNSPRDLEVQVTRSKLESLVAPLVDRTMHKVLEVLKKVRMQPAQIDNILLVGGQSRMPMIWSSIERLFGKLPNKSVHPDEAVAVGAALLADAVDRIDSVVLIDVLPVTIGVGLPGGRFFRMLENGTSLPSQNKNTIRTFKENQNTLELTIFQGESDRVVDNEYLGTVTISGISPAPKGAVQLELTFGVDQEGLLKISSCELPAGKGLKTLMQINDTRDSLRQKLQIPVDEKTSERVGVPVSLRQDSQSNMPGQGNRGSLLGKLFKRKK